MAVVSNEAVPDQPGQKGLDPDPGRLTVTRACAVGLTAILLACLALVACGGSRHSANATTRSAGAGGSPGTAPTGTTPPVPPTNTTPGGAPVAATPPNIVFVLTDDLSMNLVQYMPHVVGLQSAGMTFSNYFVSDSLCCPSRSSIFTGELPHNTGVFSNYGNDGGFRIFHRLGDEQRTFVLDLQRQGYRTALMGKYLNGYLAGARADGSSTTLPASYIPRGWNEWDVAGWGYNEYNYRLNQDGTVRYYAHRPQDYLTNVIGGLGNRFITHSVAIGKPFFLELATFAPHSPYIPAPQDRRSFPGLTAPRPPSFDRLPTDAPLWLGIHKPLQPRQIVRINRAFRRRVQSVQAVDRMIASIQQTLQARGVANNTYIVFSSDNGLHTGEYRLMPGKLTAFDTDIHVPLIVAGPGVPAGSTTPAMAENIDLAETFTAIAGTSISGDGHSLLAAAPRSASARLAQRAPRRAPRQRSQRRRSGLPAAGRRRPADLRSDSHDQLPLRRVQRWRDRVLQPAHRPIRAPQPICELDRARPAASARRRRAPPGLPRQPSSVGGPCTWEPGRSRRRYPARRARQAGGRTRRLTPHAARIASQPSPNALQATMAPPPPRPGLRAPTAVSGRGCPAEAARRRTAAIAPAPSAGRRGRGQTIQRRRGGGRSGRRGVPIAVGHDDEQWTTRDERDLLPEKASVVGGLAPQCGDRPEVSRARDDRHAQVISVRSRGGHKRAQLRLLGR